MKYTKDNIKPMKFYHGSSDKISEIIKIHNSGNRCTIKWYDSSENSNRYTKDVIEWLNTSVWYVLKPKCTDLSYEIY